MEGATVVAGMAAACGEGGGDGGGGPAEEHDSPHGVAVAHVRKRGLGGLEAPLLRRLTCRASAVPARTGEAVPRVFEADDGQLQELCAAREEGQRLAEVLGVTVREEQAVALFGGTPTARHAADQRNLDARGR